ncbi:5'-3' exonuclease, putative [Plasmodium berghei]|uniref:Exonuclease/flap endonuclease PbExo n=2 Tax=Plasmodium berghei TaxID=5821 RepID=EXO_PLABA|nr:5'-3' exonuclease, putative [Plasmodium berghei ANKA]CXH92121.1 5'-3' exonuclease, putative [Plasmodium berghei]SCL90633.1 5'-3' exonuclease, putative [Plasmodium berghei]SCM15318.1 5'-3' exonuclease, putative [Plasmodium berghei]SCM17110.1 5'-3' exonuclease, putative [Plasmodium berghei]SCN22090.1 5'-3' exonuclease, putative [Plasmodium berghei]|eukprot:XP_034419901.1 5'-3' exonuclease, putative [Plasmodium berghei ANKA]
MNKLFLAIICYLKSIIIWSSIHINVYPVNCKFIYYFNTKNIKGKYYPLKHNFVKNICFISNCNNKSYVQLWKNSYPNKKKKQYKKNIFSNYILFKNITLENGIQRLAKAFARKKKNEEHLENEKNLKKNFETFLIIDGSSLLFKNYFGMPFLKNENDINLSTIYGFTQSLNKIYKLFSPSYIAIVFDSKTSNKEKREIYAQYKTLRKKNPEELYDQLKLVSEFCDIIGIKTIISENVESDNYIASLVDQIYNTIYTNNELAPNHYETGLISLNNDEIKENNFRIVIVSSDKDLLQLLEYNDNAHNNIDISVCQPNRKYRIVNAHTFIQEHNIYPNQYSDYLILAGDKTDGISGIPNIGDKTSKYLLKEYYSIDNILKNIHNLPPKLQTIFINNIENINMFRKLIKLKCETNQSINLSEYKQVNIKNFELFQNIVDKYSLHKLLKKTVILNHPM